MPVWRTQLERLRAWGLGEQALKAALAAGLAWGLGGLVPGAPAQPYLAPLTAMLTVQLTIAESVSGAIQRTVGAAVGVLVSVVASNAIGISPLSIALLVLVAQAIGTVLRLSVIGTSQVMVTALLVLTIGDSVSYNYAWARIAETIVGALVGVLVNAVLIPPSYVPAAAEATRGVVESLRGELDALATELRGGLTLDVASGSLERMRQLARDVEDSRQVLLRAETSLRFNLLAVRDRQQTEVSRDRLQALERAAIQTRSIARALSDALANGRPAWLEPAATGMPLGNLIGSAVRLLETSFEGDDTSSAYAAVQACRAQLLERARADSSLLLPDGWVGLAAVLATVDRLASDLHAGSEEAA